MDVQSEFLRRQTCSGEGMDLQQFLQNLGERVSGSASVRNVYGDPVSTGNRTVLPVAAVRYAFGGGGGARGESGGQNGGGGGRVWARPAGALEITAEGTQFIPFDDRRRLRAAMACGFLLGALATALTAAACPRGRRR